MRLVNTSSLVTSRNLPHHLIHKFRHSHSIITLSRTITTATTSTTFSTTSPVEQQPTCTSIHHSNSMKNQRLVLSTLVAASTTTTAAAAAATHKAPLSFVSRGYGCSSYTHPSRERISLSISSIRNGGTTPKSIPHLATNPRNTFGNRSTFRRFSSSSNTNDDDNDKGNDQEMQEIVDLIAEMQQTNNKQQQQLVKSGKRRQQKRTTTALSSAEEEEGDDAETDLDDEYNPPDYAVEQLTMDWLKRIVIGLNLCPFADKPLRDEKLKIKVIRGDDPQVLLGAILYEALQRVHQPGTTLVVAPECFPDDFESYLEVVQAFEEDIMPYPLPHLHSDSLQGIIQVAPFHPHFEFQGSGSDGIDNYTNRSPYPIFHILREEEVEWAVSKLGGDASQVWQRNVDLLEDLDETMGRSSIENLFDVSSGKPIKGQLGKILSRHRLKMSSSSNGQEEEDEKDTV